MLYNSGTDSIVADIDYWAGSDSTTYPIADKTRNANQAVDRVTSLIMRSDASHKWDDSNATSSQLITTSAVSASRTASITATWLKILRVRVTDASGNYITLTPVTRDELTDSQLATTNTGTPSKYAKVGNLIIFDAVYTGTMEVQFQRAGSFFTTGSTTTEPGFASPFHRLVSLYAALDYTQPNELEARSRKIQERISQLEAELVEFYSSRDADQTPNLRLRKEDYGALGMT